MNVGIIGYGNQGRKRAKYLNKKLKFVYDENLNISKYKNLTELPLDKVSSVFLCVPDTEKLKLIKFLLKKKKHVLVEKPLILKKKDLHTIKKLRKNKYLVYTAYNHRFEPSIISLKKQIDQNFIGKIYSVNIFYGNGTSLVVKNSTWKDKGNGVLTDLGSHIIDTLMFLFPKKNFLYEIVEKNSFENKSFDHVVFKTTNTNIKIFCEATLLSWKNDFYIDILGEHGSLHVRGLCKWGPSYLTQRKRKYPSGIPKEKIKKISCDDPTWRKEHFHFEKIIKNPLTEDLLNKDIYIASQLEKLIK